jgi:hypothetical protein
MQFSIYRAPEPWSQLQFHRGAIHGQKPEIEQRMQVSPQQQAILRVVRSLASVGHDMRRLQRLHGIAAGYGAPARVCRQERRSESLLAPAADYLRNRAFALVLSRARVEILGWSRLCLAGRPGVAGIGFIGADKLPALALNGFDHERKALVDLIKISTNHAETVINVWVGVQVGMVLPGLVEAFERVALKYDLPPEAVAELAEAIRGRAPSRTWRRS